MIIIIIINLPDEQNWTNLVKFKNVLHFHINFCSNILWYYEDEKWHFFIEIFIFLIFTPLESWIFADLKKATDSQEKDIKNWKKSFLNQTLVLWNTKRKFQILIFFLSFHYIPEQNSVCWQALFLIFLNHDSWKRHLIKTHQTYNLCLYFAITLANVYFFIEFVQHRRINNHD